MTRSKLSASKTLLSAVGLTALSLLLSLILGIAFTITMLSIGYAQDSTAVLVGITIFSQLGFLILGLLYIRRTRVNAPFGFFSKSDLIYTGAGIGIVLLTGLALSLVLSNLDLLPESGLERIGRANPTFLLILAVLSFVLIAPSEELLFRGAVQKRLRERFDPMVSVAVSSLLFGSLHLLNYSGSLLPLLSTTLVIAFIGGILGTLYERTNNLLVPILVHAVYNFVLLVSSYLSMK